MKQLFYILGIAISVIALQSCKTEGCTDGSALNYFDKAIKDDGTCIYAHNVLVGEWVQVKPICTGGPNHDTLRFYDGNIITTRLTGNVNKPFYTLNDSINIDGNNYYYELYNGYSTLFLKEYIVLQHYTEKLDITLKRID